MAEHRGGGRTVLAALLALALVVLGRRLGLFLPYEVYGVPGKFFQLGYFKFGRSLLPFAGALAVCAIVAWVGLKGPLEVLRRYSGRSRVWTAAVACLCLFTLVPGRPAGLMSILGLAAVLPLGVLLCRACFGDEVAGVARTANRAVSAVGAWSASGFLAVASLSGLALATTASIALFDRMPHIHDSITYWVQGKLYASGRLAWDLPATVAPFFQFPFILELSERQVPMYPPGTPLLLALGHLAGVPWLVPPLVCAGFLLLLYFFCREAAAESTARLAAALALVSPFLLVMCGEYMSHPASLLCFQFFLLAYARTLRTSRSSVWAVLAGVSLACCVACRPLTALALALPFGCDMLVRLAREPRVTLPAAMAMGLGLVLMLIPVLALNAHLTGEALLFPHAAYLKGTYHLGFGAGNLGNDHWPEKGVAQSLANLNSLQKYLFEWPLPALAPLFLLLLTSERLTRWQGLCLGSALCLVGVYGLHYFQDLCLGPRYFYEAAGILFFLSAAGLERAFEVLMTAGFTAERARGGIALAVAACTLSGGLLFGPGLASFFSDRYYGSGPELRSEVARLGLGKESLVLVPEPLWNAAIGLEPGDLKSGVVFARDMKDVAPLLEAYPERRTWRARVDPPGVRLDPVRASGVTGRGPLDRP